MESTGYSAIYSNYQSLLNGVCMKYDSLCVNPKSITYSCILLAWVFSYPSNKIPDELNYCKDVPSHDFELIVKWVILSRTWAMLRPSNLSPNFSLVLFTST